MNTKFAVILAGLALALCVGSDVAFAGDKRDGTVEKKPADAAAKTAGKQCVIDLTAPKEKGHCELGPNDPPAKLVVKGWYRSTYLRSFDSPVAGKHKDERASAIFERNKEAKLDSLKFWQVDYANVFPLNPVAGETDTWESFPQYTKDELDQAMHAAIKWAQAWKRYRGNKFDPYNR